MTATDISFPVTPCIIDHTIKQKRTSTSWNLDLQTSFLNVRDLSAVLPLTYPLGHGIISIYQPNKGAVTHGEKVLLLTPGEHKTEFEIKPDNRFTLEAKRNFVGGMLAAMPITPNIDLWYNDEFLLLEMSPTIVVFHGNNEPTTICGPVFFSGHNGKGASKGLNQDQMSYISQMINANIVQLTEQAPPFKTRIIPWLQLAE